MKTYGKKETRERKERRVWIGLQGTYKKMVINKLQEHFGGNE